MAKKAKVASYAIPLEKPDYNVVLPTIKRDLRIVYSKAGLDIAGTTTLVYTVPTDKIYRLTDIFNERSGINTNSEFRFKDASGNTFYTFIPSTGGVWIEKAPWENILEKELKLVGGDQIEVYYDSNDAGGYWTIGFLGIEETNTLLF